MLSDKPRRVAPPVVPVGRPVTPQPATSLPVNSQPVMPRSIALDSDESGMFRKLAFYFGVALIFIKVSVLPEFLGTLIGTNLYILYIVTPPALAGLLATGAVRRTLRGRPARYWMAFFAWVVVAAVFSSWIGGSLNRVKDYAINDLMLLFIVAGLATNWSEVRVVFYTVAAAALVNLLEARLFMDVQNGRIQLWENGIISNSNDLASQLLLVLPFVLWIAMDKNRGIFIRIALYGCVAYGLWVVVGTASRGAFVGILAAFAFVLWRATMRQRMIAVLGGGLMALILMAALPDITTNRLGSLFGEQNIEAQQSADARNRLFRQSLTYTIQHPLFGVGPDQFSNYQSNEHEVKQAMWHPTHCAWTQISSECGIPGLILFVLGLGAAFFGVARTYRAARERGNADIANACFCYQLALIGFLVSISFLSNAYTATIPLMVGLGVAISFTAARQMAKPSPAPMLPMPIRY
jgi:putative inorganic carbon (HCO3(-)) transporter